MAGIVQEYAGRDVLLYIIPLYPGADMSGKNYRE
jgi:hypothetical protein